MKRAAPTERRYCNPKPTRPGPATLLALLVLGACAAPPDQGPRFTAVGYDALPGWRQDDHAAALKTLARSCRKPMPRRASRAALAWRMARGARDWRKPCAALAAAPPRGRAAARAYFERWFQPYRISDGRRRKGLVTGYYEPVMNGSRHRSARYAVPLHGLPRDLLTARGRVLRRASDGRLAPYPTRREIASRAGEWNLPVLLWLADPVDAFFLHIQGSGRVRLAEGGTVRVGFAGSNGRAYVSIGRLMRRRGHLKPGGISAQSIRRWLRGHPREGRALMLENPRYIFFRIRNGAGPLGSQNVALTPGRSLAVDPAIIPLGAPVWLRLTGGRMAGPKFSRLMVAQDTGAAIKGPLRADFFWGGGRRALAHAGVMKATAEIYVLLPR